MSVAIFLSAFFYLLRLLFSYNSSVEFFSNFGVIFRNLFFCFSVFYSFQIILDGNTEPQRRFKYKYLPEQTIKN